MIDFNKIKNSKALKIALAIALPTIIVAGYLGYKYIKKRKDEKIKGKTGVPISEKIKKMMEEDGIKI